MSNLVLKRNQGESVFIYAGGLEVLLTIRKVHKSGVKI